MTLIRSSPAHTGFTMYTENREHSIKMQILVKSTSEVLHTEGDANVFFVVNFLKISIV